MVSSHREKGEGGFVKGVVARDDDDLASSKIKTSISPMTSRVTKKHTWGWSLGQVYEVV